MIRFLHQEGKVKAGKGPAHFRLERCAAGVEDGLPGLGRWVPAEAGRGQQTDSPREPPEGT